jgi:hypothetical protein
MMRGTRGPDQTGERVLTRSALLAAYLLLVVFPARAESWWLVIGDSNPSPQPMALYASFGGYPQGFLIQTSDCGQPTNLYAWVMEVQHSAEFAQRVLSRLSENHPKAYVLRCDVQPQSLLSWGLSAVDASIADVPDRAMTWTDRDRVSSAHALADGRTVIVVRTFDRARWNSEEGKRSKVFLGPAFADLIALSEDCPEVGGFATQDGLIAFHCGSPTGPVFHDVLLFDRHGRPCFVSSVVAIRPGLVSASSLARRRSFPLMASWRFGRSGFPSHPEFFHQPKSSGCGWPSA